MWKAKCEKEGEVEIQRYGIKGRKGGKTCWKWQEEKAKKMKRIVEKREIVHPLSRL